MSEIELKSIRKWFSDFKKKYDLSYNEIAKICNMKRGQDVERIIFKTKYRSMRAGQIKTKLEKWSLTESSKVRKESFENLRKWCRNFLSKWKLTLEGLCEYIPMTPSGVIYVLEKCSKKKPLINMKRMMIEVEEKFLKKHPKENIVVKEKESEDTKFNKDRLTFIGEPHDFVTYYKDVSKFLDNQAKDLMKKTILESDLSPYIKKYKDLPILCALQLFVDYVINDAAVYLDDIEDATTKRDKLENYKKYNFEDPLHLQMFVMREIIAFYMSFDFLSLSTLFDVEDPDVLIPSSELRDELLYSILEPRLGQPLDARNFTPDHCFITTLKFELSNIYMHTKLDALEFLENVDLFKEPVLGKMYEGNYETFILSNYGGSTPFYFNVKYAIALDESVLGKTLYIKFKNGYWYTGQIYEICQEYECVKFRTGNSDVSDSFELTFNELEDSNIQEVKFLDIGN